MAKATTLPPEHREPEPKQVRDMKVGEEAYVDPSAVVTSKRTGRVFVAWDARLRNGPEHPTSIFAPLRVTAEIIGVSARTVRRWRERLELHGYDGLADRRKGLVSPKR